LHVILAMIVSAVDVSRITMLYGSIG